MFTNDLHRRVKIQTFAVTNFIATLTRVTKNVERAKKVIFQKKVKIAMCTPLSEKLATALTWEGGNTLHFTYGNKNQFGVVEKQHNNILYLTLICHNGQLHAPIYIVNF